MTSLPGSRIPLSASSASLPALHADRALHAAEVMVMDPTSRVVGVGKGTGSVCITKCSVLAKLKKKNI